MPFREQDVERDRRFSGTAQAGNDHHLVARNIERDVLEIVLARAVDADGVVSGERTRLACSVRRLAERFFGGAQYWLVNAIRINGVGNSRRGAANSTRGACAPQNFLQKLSGMRRVHFRHGLGRSRRDQLPAFVARFGPEVDHPIGALDHFKVVLDHDQRVAALDQSLKQPHQDRDVVEMQSGRRLVEDEEIAIRVLALVGEMPHQFQPLRFAAG